MQSAGIGKKKHGLFKDGGRRDERERERSRGMKVRWESFFLYISILKGRGRDGMGD